MCNCIADIEERVNREEDAVQARKYDLRGQCSLFAFRPYTKAGVPSKHNRATVVEWSFCPFCGAPRELK